MRHKWRHILALAALARTPLGRFELLHSLYNRAWPLLSRWAILHRLTLGRNARVVAVVGSFGKSTTTRALHAALGGPLHHYSLWGGGGAVWRAVLRIRPRDRHAVIEVAIDRPGQMEVLARLVRPDITVVMSVGSEHNRSLKTLEVTRAEKSEMVKALPESGIAVLNGDDPNVLWMKSQTRARVIAFGFNESNDIRASGITLDWPHGTRFKLHAGGETRDLRVRLIGRHMVYPILAAVAVSLAEGFTLDQVVPALETLSPTPGRMEPVRLENGAIILRDEFKSAVETIEAALDTFSQIPAERRIVIFGNIEEPSGNQRQLYRSIGEYIAKVSSRALFVVRQSDVYKSYATGASRGGLPRHKLLYYAQENMIEVVEALRSDLGPGDVVLIKGSSVQRLDRIALALMGRTVRCDISYCNVRLRCGQCPMLERGWKVDSIRR